MKIKIGDIVRMKNVRDPQKVDNTEWVIIDFNHQSVKLKHPSVGGYFVFLRKNITEVIKEAS